MTPRISQQHHLARLRADMAETAERVERLVGPLTDAQLRWSPPEGSWGVGQVLEHLVSADGDYVERLRGLVARSAPTAAPDAAWKPSLFGGLIARALAKPARLKTPKRWAPAARPRVGVQTEYLERSRELERLLERGAGLDWRRVRTASPVSPLIRLNLGDVFTILAVHATRHLAQMERVVARADFPRGA